MEAAIHGALLTVRGRMNALLPVHGIPPEILLHIFELACDHCYDGYVNFRHRHKGHKPPLPLLLTHVCRRWRDVALSAPVIWSRIDVPNKHLLDLFLVRSGAAALSLHIGHEDPGVLLGTHVERLKRLDMTRSIDRSRPTLAPVQLQLSAPALECLTVLPHHGAEGYDNGFLFRALFQRQVLKLQALALYYVGEWMPRNIFPCLTHLCLSGIVNFGGSSGEVTCLVTLLANTPALQYLEVMGLAGGKFASAPMESRSRASLPSLRAITCSQSCASDAFCLLSALDFPSSVVIRLYNLNTLTDSSISWPSALLPNGMFQMFTHLNVRVVDRQLELTVDGRTAGFWLQVYTEGLNIDWQSWLMRLNIMFPMPAVRSLRVTTNQHGVVPTLLNQVHASLAELSLFVDTMGERSPTLESDKDAVLEAYAALASEDLSACAQLETLQLETLCSDPYAVLRTTALAAMAATRMMRRRPLRTLVVATGPLCAHCADKFSRGLVPIIPYFTRAVDFRPGAARESFGLSDTFDVPEADQWWDSQSSEDIRPRLWKQAVDPPYRIVGPVVSHDGSYKT
ncbi:hypothetical protein C8Q73DRAFT_703848 [Cubamyces lactineus]|nr:hypothetical protein C8Q73DRAFT_703848 [Cubamyces lactineus]